MPTTLSPVDLANVALSKIGAQSINSLLDGANAAALACNNNFNLCYLEVSRSAKWNCLLTTAQLTQIPQTPITGNPVPAPVPWAPLTAYAANVYLTFGGYYYITAYAYTSTNNFANDLTTGALVQTDQSTSSPFTDFQLLFGNFGSRYPSGWAFQYALPADFQLLGVLNDNICWDFDGAGGDDYEIMGDSIFCARPIAVIQYVQNQPDTTRFDSMMANAFTLKLASAIATPLRQDGGKMESMMLEAYEQALKKARTKNAGEQKARRFNPVRSSRFTRARYYDLNGSIYIPGFLAQLIFK